MATAFEERTNACSSPGTSATVFGYTRTTGQDGAADVLGSQQAKATALFWKLKESTERLAWGGFHIDLDPAVRTRPLVERPEGWKVLRQLRRGDYLLLGSIELVGKSVGDFVETVRKVRERGVGVQLLEPAVDFETPEGQQFLKALEATSKADHKRRCEERGHQVRKCRSNEHRMLNRKTKHWTSYSVIPPHGRRKNKMLSQWWDRRKVTLCRLVSWLAYRGMKGKAISDRIEELLCSQSKWNSYDFSPRYFKLDLPKKPRLMSNRKWNRQKCDNTLKAWRKEGEAAYRQLMAEEHQYEREHGYRDPATGFRLKASGAEQDWQEKFFTCRD